MSQIVREGFAQFCKRQKAGLLIVGEIQKQEKKDQEALLDVQEKRLERKYNLFYENLDLIMRHKDESIATPRYANIDAHYLLEGGGCYVGRLCTSRQINIAGRLSRSISSWEPCSKFGKQVSSASPAGAGRRLLFGALSGPRFRAGRTHRRYAPSARRKSMSRTVVSASTTSLRRES